MSAKKNSHSLAEHLGDAIYGALDGTVTTFAVMAGAIGANLETRVIIILGLANLIADGFSMAVGSYLSEQSQIEYHQNQIKSLKKSINQKTTTANLQLKAIYQNKGFQEPLLSQVVNVIAHHPKSWLNDLMQFKQINRVENSPRITSLVTFTSFVVIGFMPILPLILIKDISFLNIILFVSTVLFGVGALRSRLSPKSWWRSGLEIMVAGVAASLIAFGIGETLNQLL